VHVALNVVLFKPLGAVGLATATSIGLWINLGALIALAIAWDMIDFDEVFAKTLGATFVACALLTMTATFGRAPALAFGRHFGSQANLVALIALGAAGAIVYGGALVAALRLAGVRLGSLGRRRR
jgi:putative peptidoglycan lipid II flippase